VILIKFKLKNIILNAANSRFFSEKKLITLLKLIIVLFFLPCTIIAQVTQQWVTRYNGSGNANDIAYSVAIDNEGNIYVTGSSYGNGTSYDYATIKYNSSGNEKWVARYNGPLNSDDNANCIAVDIEGNVYVTGYSGIGTNYDFVTIKYNSEGDELWVARYNGTGNSNDYPHSLAIDSFGNVFVTGSSIGNGTNEDYVTIKYNSSGDEQWIARYNGPGNAGDFAQSLVNDDSGNVFVTGKSFGNGTSYDYATIKYDFLGVEQWVTRYNGPGNIDDYANSIAIDSGNIYVTGKSYGNGTNYDYATIKYNSSGVQQWVAKYNGTGNGSDEATSLAVDGSGNVYVTGTSYEVYIVNSYDYSTIKYNSLGIQQWVARYNGTGSQDDNAYSLAIDGSGNTYVTGSSSNGANRDYVTIKYNSSGVRQWLARYNGPANQNDFSYSLKIDGLGNAYVTGYSIGSGTGTDYATIKYSYVLGIENISTEVPSSYSLSQNYPNPFNPRTKIRFNIQKSEFRSQNSEVTLKVYDIMGRELQTLVNEKLNPGTYETTFDGSNYSSGVYFYRLMTDGYSETKRMLLIK